jgi:hypothetical protein
MSWEAISAVSTLGTLIVITVTAIAAAIQLRHMRSANHISTALGFMDKWATPEYRALINYVTLELEGKLKDPAYRESLMRIPADRIKHPEIAMLDMWEQMGSLVKLGAVPEDAYFETASAICLMMWERLKPVIAIMRRRRGDEVYDNFEYVAARAMRWEAKHPDGTYPRGTPRLPVIDPYPDDAQGIAR